MSSVCPPQLPACPRDASPSGEQSPEQLGMGRSPYGILLLLLDPLILPSGTPHAALQLSLLDLSWFFSSCVTSVHLGAQEIQTFESWLFFSEVGEVQERGGTVTFPLFSAGPRENSCPAAHAVPHSSPHTHPEPRQNSCLKPTGTLPDRGI